MAIYKSDSARGELNLTTLEQSRERGDLVTIYRMMNGMEDLGVVLKGLRGWKTLSDGGNYCG